MTDDVRKELENRLETVYHIRINLEDCSEVQRLRVIASLLNAYDGSWQVESIPSLIGQHNLQGISNNEETSAMAKKDIATLKRWMIIMGVGYLIPSGTNLADPKKFSHLCSMMMDKIEQRHGAKLKVLIRHIIGKQNRLSVKAVALNMRGNNAAENLDSPSSSAKTVDLESNPFKGRTLPRSAVQQCKDEANKEHDFAKPDSGCCSVNAGTLKTTEDPFKSGSTIPRTPSKSDGLPENEEKALPLKGKSIPRTPITTEASKEEAAKNVILPGKSIPRTPVAAEPPIINVDDIVIVPKVDEPEENPAQYSVPKRNFIPSGKNALPRTPFHIRKPDEEEADNVDLTAEEDNFESPKAQKENTAAEILESPSKRLKQCSESSINVNHDAQKETTDEGKMHTDSSHSRENDDFAELASSKSPDDSSSNARSTESSSSSASNSSVKNSAKNSGKNSAKNSSKTIKKGSAKNSADNSPKGSPKRTSKSSSANSSKNRDNQSSPVEAMYSVVEPSPIMTRDANEENGAELAEITDEDKSCGNQLIEADPLMIDSNLKNDKAIGEKSDKDTSLSLKATKKEVEKKKDGKKKKNVIKSKIDTGIRRKSPRIINQLDETVQKKSFEEIVEAAIEAVASRARKGKNKDDAKDEQAQRLQSTRVQDKNDKEEQDKDENKVKLPEIKAARLRRGQGGRKQLHEIKDMDGANVTIEEFVPALKMAKGKRETKISDEIYKTPMVKAKPPKPKKKAGKLLPIEDEMYQTPKRRKPRGQDL